MGLGGDLEAVTAPRLLSPALEWMRRWYRRRGNTWTLAGWPLVTVAPDAVGARVHLVPLAHPDREIVTQQVTDIAIDDRVAADLCRGGERRERPGDSARSELEHEERRANRHGDCAYRVRAISRHARSAGARVAGSSGWRARARAPSRRRGPGRSGPPLGLQRAPPNATLTVRAQRECRAAGHEVADIGGRRPRRRRVPRR